MPTSLAFQRTQSPRSAMPPSRSHRGPLPLNPYLTAFLFYLITTISDPLSLSLPVTCCNSFNLQASKISKHSRQTYSQKPLLVGMSQRLFLAHAGWSYSKGPCCLQWGDCEAMAPGAIREREAESKAPSLTQLRGRVPRGSICLCIYFILNMSLNFSGVHLPSPENQINAEDQSPGCL